MGRFGGRRSRAPSDGGAGVASPAGKVARADEWDGLENRCGRKATVGSNPTPSATKAQLSWSVRMAEQRGLGPGSEGKARSVPLLYHSQRVLLAHLDRSVHQRR